MPPHHTSAHTFCLRRHDHALMLRSFTPRAANRRQRLAAPGGLLPRRSAGDQEEEEGYHPSPQHLEGFWLVTSLVTRRSSLEGFWLVAPLVTRRSSEDEEEEVDDQGYHPSPQRADVSPRHGASNLRLALRLTQIRDTTSSIVLL